MDYENVIKRLMEEMNVSTQGELADVLGYKASSAISNWKKQGIDWNRVISKGDSLDLNYIITGERAPRSSKSSKGLKSIERSWDRLEGAVNEHGISYEVRDQMILSLRDRAKNLSGDLEYFSQLIDRLNQIDE